MPKFFGVPGQEPSTGDGEGEEEPGGGDAAKGEELFNATCMACHGADATGIAGLGPSLVGNTFVAGLSDEELVVFLTIGRPADHPENTTGIAMPPKGGNPGLSEADLAAIAAFLRELE